MEVLLIEPNSRNKYPPLGLMKISTFHKTIRNDKVYFFKGTNSAYYKDRRFSSKIFDRIYISAIFTFKYKKIKEAIELAKNHIINSEYSNIFIGGVAANLLQSTFEKEGITVVEGLLNRPGSIDLAPEDKCIDTLIPDYDILNEIEYQYPTNDAYIGYATRGCPNNCSFCAVKTIEPNFIPYYDISEYVKAIKALLQKY